VTAVVRAAQAVRWYVRELLGDSAYERYVTRHAREHPGAPPLTEREFWRSRDAGRATGPGCC
jgi:uncharacterized short protein YbdD (DUF466 family)